MQKTILEKELTTNQTQLLDVEQNDMMNKMMMKLILGDSLMMLKHAQTQGHGRS